MYQLLAENDLQVGGDGKGRSAWIAYGYVLSREESKVIALHDCDIVNHSRELVAQAVLSRRLTHHRLRLLQGILCPGDGQDARPGDTAVRDAPHPQPGKAPRAVSPFSSSSTAFATPGGRVFDADRTRRINRIPNDWGLEVETLAEVYRNYSLRRICQAELCETYEHKHQALSAEDPKTGLMKMAIDIAKSVFRNLAIEGIILSPERAAARSSSTTSARPRTRSSATGTTPPSTAWCSTDHQESIVVEAFTRALQMAGRTFFEDPLYSPLIPNWNRVISAIPSVLERVQELVEKENAG